MKLLIVEGTSSMRRLPSGNEILFRAIAFLVLATVYTLVFPVVVKYLPSRSAYIEISGLRPGEKIAIERIMLTFYRLEATADRSGKAVFSEVPPGNWMIIKGGTPELRRIVIPVQERVGGIQKGPIRVRFVEEVERTPWKRLVLGNRRVS